MKACAVAVVLVLSGCADASAPKELGGDRPLAATTGAILVTAATVGADEDENGYLVAVNGEASPTRRVLPNNAFTVAGLPPGIYEVRLDEIADNCAAYGPNPQTVTVAAGGTVTAAFAVTCVGRGSIELRILTNGSPADPDGYVARLEGHGPVISVHVASSDTASVRVAPGSYRVSLLGVAGNCSLASDPLGPTRDVTVATGKALAIPFAVTCGPTASRIAFVRGGRIHAVNADGTGLVQLSDGPDDADPAWSPDGTRIAFARNTGAGNEWSADLKDIHVMNADGSHVVRLTHTEYARQPAWSPDGRRIAFATRCGGDGCILVADAEKGGLIPGRLGFDRGFIDGPAWSPDGAWIAFTSDWRMFDFVYDLYAVKADGSNVTELAIGPFGSIGSHTFYFQPAWSPDGGRIATVVCGSAWDNCFPYSDIAVMKSDGSSRTTVAATGGFARPTWSPGGDELAYAEAACRGCSSRIYLVRADGTNKRLLVADGHSPSWRR